MIGRKAWHVFTGWRGYFAGSAMHIKKSDLAPLIVRRLAQRQHRLSAKDRSPPPGCIILIFDHFGPSANST